jgi:outer membrane protein assembly factor BamB
VLYLALSPPGGSGSWLQAIDLSDGSPLWASEPREGAAFARVELHGPRLLVEDRGSELLLAYSTEDGRLLWEREGPFCPSPSPVARVYGAPRQRGSGGSDGGRFGGGGADTSSSSGSTGFGDGDADSIGSSGSGSGGGDRSGGEALGCHHHSRGDGAEGVLLLARDCDGLDGLAAVDVATGRTLWSGLDAPRDARPARACSWVEAAGAAGFAGCNAPGDGEQPEEGDDPSVIWLISFDLVTGRRIWARRVEVEGAAGFDPNAQAWGQAPRALRTASSTGGDAVVFLTNTTAVAASYGAGEVLWSAPVAPGERIAPWQLPAELSADVRIAGAGAAAPGAARSHVAAPLLLLHTLRGAGNKTTLYALDASSGRAAWTREFNGSMQEPLAPASGGAAPLPIGALVAAETCRRGRCCLRGLNASSGKVAWAMCLDAARGTDPTNPRAQVRAASALVRVALVFVLVFIVFCLVCLI